MQSKAGSVAEYLAELPADRRALVDALRRTILDNLDGDYEEGMQYGMIGYYVPHRVFPAGYHCDPKQPLPFAGIGSQKNAVSLYLTCLYTHDEQDPELQRFRREWAATGKRLDMGKACIRVKKLDDVPLEVLAATIRRFPAREHVARYEAARAEAAAAKSKRKSAAGNS